MWPSSRSRYPRILCDWAIKVSEGLITKAFAGAYPIQVDKISKSVVKELPTEINSAQELVIFGKQAQEVYARAES